MKIFDTKNAAKRRKRMGYLAACSLLLLLLCDCSGKTEDKEKLLGQTVVDASGCATYSDLGAIFQEGSLTISYFLDPESGAYAPLCTRINCSHDSEECDAHWLGIITAIIGDHMYYIKANTDKNGFRGKAFYKADVDGRNERLLHEVYPAETSYYSGYEGGYLIYTYCNSFDESGTPKDTRDPGIYLLNLETEKLKHIDMPEADNAIINMATVAGDHLYFDYFYRTEPEGQRYELWKYGLTSGEKTCVWSRTPEQMDGYLLGCGQLMVVDSYDTTAHIEDLSTGKIVEMGAKILKNRGWRFFDGGLAIYGQGEIRVWHADTGEAELLGTEKLPLIITAITPHWVYADRFDSDGNYTCHVYLPRGKFEKGELEWRQVPSPTALTHTAAPDRFEDRPDDYFVTWASWTKVPKEDLEEINRKLEADGYGFGLKVLTVGRTDMDTVKACGADIVTMDGFDHNAERALRAGLFEALDNRLAGSALYDAIPRLCWEAVRRDGSICYIPNETAQDRHLQLWVNREKLPADFPDLEFDGDLLELERYLSEDHPLYYSALFFQFAETFGYANDYDSGLLFAEDGTPVDPLSDERTVEWLRTMNRWYHEKKLVTDSRKLGRCAFAFSAYIDSELSGEWQKLYDWKSYAFHRVNESVGILASSTKKDEAFQLLELVHTDPSYAGLLVYGSKAMESGVRPSSDRGYGFGLDTGLTWGNWGLNYFSDTESKKRYYDENILPSPSLYLELPEECERLFEIENKWNIGNGILIVCDDFDAMLQKYRDELKKPMDTVLKKLSPRT